MNLIPWAWRLLKPLLPHIMIATVLLGAVWFIHHKGYEEARAEAEQARLEDALRTEARLRQTEQNITTAINGVDRNLSARIRKNAELRGSLNLEGMMNDREKYFGPACELDGGLLDALNRIRAASDPTTP